MHAKTQPAKCNVSSRKKGTNLLQNPQVIFGNIAVAEDSVPGTPWAVSRESECMQQFRPFSVWPHLPLVGLPLTPALIQSGWTLDWCCWRALEIEAGTRERSRPVTS